MRRYRPFSRATWTIYLLLLAFRIFNALSPGYIHPDEFFQSAEITAGNIFGLDVNIPWEYKPELPCRSILIPVITTGIPYLLLKAWFGTDPDYFVTSRALFITQRLAFVLISLIIGVLFAVGTFTRITFVVYGFPLGVMFLYLNFKAAFTKNQSIVAAASRFITACLPLAAGLAATSAFAVLIDSIYFHKLIIYNISNGIRLSLRDILITHPKDWHQLSYKGSLTLTMWNNLRYNLDEKNLAEHGLHPRFFHLFLNFPVLFGNLALIAVATLVQKCRAGEWSSQSRLVTALSYSGIFGIGVLSSMPHQEARFLTPLILPLIVSLSGRISKLGRKFWPLWLLGNGIMALVLGLFHQSGLVPAMEIVQQQALGFQGCREVNSNASSINDHILCFTNNENPDWREKDRAELLQDLEAHGQQAEETIAMVNRTLLGSAQNQNEGGQLPLLFRKAGPLHWQRTILIAPSTVDFTDQDFYSTRKQISRHANFDHIQTIVQDPMNSLQLNIFYL
ncbi:hypothetical protein BGZ72_010430 [Mortierella alpina]|nr:hypothetical protein BGZ72_010430 [Mortierella alpina]